MTTRKTFWLTFLLLGLSVSQAWAQLYSGSVTGVITDPSNAVIPGAQVVLEDQEKGFVFKVESDGSGRYLLRSVPPSTYKLTVEARGFQKQTRADLKVDINQSVTVDFSLPLPTSAEAVTITGEAPILAAEEASIGQVFDRKFMDALPILGRNTLNLSYLTPGVVAATAGKLTVEESANNFATNGGRAWTADVLVDGVTTTNYEQNGGLQMVIALPSPDAIDEFKVQTSNFSAEFGFTGATVVNMVMRSGTNQFHGSLYEYFRNAQLEANNFFNNAKRLKRPVFGRNNFGGTIGGPIKSNKTFFFFDYDGYRQRTMRTRNFGVPSAAERTGDFGELCGYKSGTFDAAGRCSKAAGQLWDPYTGVYSASAGGAVRSTYIPFNNLATYTSPGNQNLNGTGYQLPLKAGNLIDPVAFKEIQYMPLPNLQVGAPGYQYFNNWTGSGTEPQTYNAWDVKIDHRLSDATLLSGKYTQQHENHRRYNAFGNAADTGAIGQDFSYLYLAGLNLTHTFTPSLLFAATYGWNRFREDLPGIMGDYPDVDPVQLLGLPAYMKASGESVFPGLGAGDSYARNTISVGTQGWTHIKRGQDTHQALATLSWIKGSHELKFGSELRMYRINWYMPGNPGGQFNFTYLGSSQTPSSSSGGDAMASLLMGIVNSGNYSVDSAFSTQSFGWGSFFQDNWKVTRNLTLNLGVRYDVYVPRTERYNRMNWLDPNVASPLQVPGLGALHGAEIFATPNDRHAYNTYYGNLQPRFGFAWTVQNKTVVRGGYGIFTSPSMTGVTGGGFGGSGFARSTSSVTTMNSDGATPWGRVSDPFPITGPLMPLGSSLGMLNDVGFAGSGPVRSMNYTPYEQAWSLGVQRELGGGFVLETSYIGKKGTHLYFGGDSNFNLLSPAAEQYSQTQIASLLSYVANPFQGIITNRNSTFSGPTIQQYRLQLPFQQYTTFGGDAPPEGNSMYHSLQLRLEKRFSSGFQFLATYVFSKALDDASVSSNDWNVGGSRTLQNPNNRHLEYSVSLYDVTHAFRFNHVYDLPFGRGKKFGNDWNPVVNGVLGGWQINGVWEFASGRPLLPSLQGGYSLPTYGSQRPDLVGRPKRNTGADWMTSYFADPSVFVRPARYAVGNAPRTLPWLRSPGTANSNLSVTKEFSLAKVREEMRLRLIAQTLNAFNTPLFAGPNMSFGSSAFGTVTTQANTPRQIELALKLSF